MAWNAYSALCSSSFLSPYACKHQKKQRAAAWRCASHCNEQRTDGQIADHLLVERHLPRGCRRRSLADFKRGGIIRKGLFNQRWTEAKATKIPNWSLSLVFLILWKLYTLYTLKSVSFILVPVLQCWTAYAHQQVMSVKIPRKWRDDNKIRHVKTDAVIQGQWCCFFRPWSQLPLWEDTSYQWANLNRGTQVAHMN